MTKLRAGQRWTYRTRAADTESTLVIGKLDKKLAKPTIVHISVEQVDVPSAGGRSSIGHLPFAEEAIKASLLELVEDGCAPDENFGNGYAQWQQANGGAFETSVAETLDLILPAMPVGTTNNTEPLADDGFDAIVTEIRDVQSEDLIEQLYRQLLALPRWYFLCEPDDARKPVEWVFPDGQNTNPAVLAFTSADRATAAGVSLGLYGDDDAVTLMPAPVAAAVDWISSTDFQNEWLCFNLSQRDFPLYVDDAVARYRAA